MKATPGSILWYIWHTKLVFAMTNRLAVLGTWMKTGKHIPEVEVLRKEISLDKLRKKITMESR